MEDHGARVPDQDCLEYILIADIGNRNEFTNAYFSRLVGTVSDVRILIPAWRTGVKARPFFSNLFVRLGLCSKFLFLSLQLLLLKHSLLGSSGPPALCPSNSLAAHLFFTFPSQYIVLDLSHQFSPGEEAIEALRSSFLHFYLKSGGNVLEINTCSYLINILPSRASRVNEFLNQIVFTHIELSHILFQSFFFYLANPKLKHLSSPDIFSHNSIISCLASKYPSRSHFGKNLSLSSQNSLPPYPPFFRGFPPSQLS